MCIHQESLLRCWMMWSMVDLNREFMASGLILSIPWDDHLTKSTLQKTNQPKKGSANQQYTQEASLRR